jgi:predicted metal-binding membrane protein
MNSAVEAALGRHRTISIAALALLTLLAWIWLFAGAGMGMEPLVSLLPLSGGEAPMSSGMSMDGSMDGAMQAAPAWSAAFFALTFSMWWIMMVAMMLPSAAPMILLYGRVAVQGEVQARPTTASFLAGYLLAWGAFSLLATVLQLLLERTGLLAPMLMASQSRWLSAAILFAAGAYQLSPLKNVCLRHCRNPAQFLSRHYRPGAGGALRMGLLHGAYCVGCCWLLMALLFVGGVMNLAWIALLTLMVAAEKILPFGRAIPLVTGLACLVWGAAMLVS